MISNTARDNYNGQDSQNENNNLVQINLSPEAQAVLAYSHRVYNRDRLLEKLSRANPHRTKLQYNKSFFICSQAYELAKSVLHKLQNKERVFLNTKYISQITRCDSTDQNKRIMEQLAILLKIEYRRLAIVDGTPYNYHYSFELQPAIIEELKAAGLWNLESMPAELRLSYNNIPDTSIRSKLDLGANFANVKNSESQNSSTELEETNLGVAKGVSVNSQTNQQATQCVDTSQESQVVETTNPKAATVTPILTKSSRLGNKRRTRTNAEQKQRKAANVSGTNPAPNVVRNGFLGGGKRLSEIQPYLTDELCETLRSRSGKLFTNKAIREITKAIAASERGSKAFFQHINGVVAYLTPALANEKRDPNKIGSDSYYTTAGMTAEDKLLHEKEKYLNETENSGIHARCDYTQFRARIAGQFPINLAYDLLTSMVGVKKQEHVLKVTMHKLVPLSKNYVQLLLKHAKGIGGYAGVSGLEFVGIASNSNFLSDLTQCRNSEPRPDLAYREETKLPKGNWGKICSAFISEYGSDLYRYWLAGLEVTEDSDNTIELKTNSGMVRERIEQNYLPFLAKVSSELGVEKVEFVK